MTEERKHEVNTEFGEDGTKAVDRISVKYPISIFCYEDQMGMKLKNAVSAVSDFP